MDDEKEKRLVAILDRTINFVKYAEAKNGAVVALSLNASRPLIRAAVHEGADPMGDVSPGGSRLGTFFPASPFHSYQPSTGAEE
jgi:hypothetical protein